MDAHTIPARERQAGLPQRLLLLLGSCLPILGAVLIAPLLPKIRMHFYQTAHADILVPVVLTMPALLIGLLGPYAGALVDRYGRKPLLLASLLLYSLFGTAPLWLDNLPAILASRFGLGLAETGIITCCTALIGDYFDGAERARMLALQTIASSVSAALFFALGGALGEIGWRAPFWLYLAGFVLLPWAKLAVWEPVPRQERDGAVPMPFPWKNYALVFGLTGCAAIGMFIVAVQLGFLLNGIGIQAPKLIGAAIGLSHLAVLAGSITTRWAARLGPERVLCSAFLFAGVSLVLLAKATVYPAVLVAVLINGYGFGLMIPTLAAWVLDELPLTLRGRGSGSFMASFYLGEFASPLVVAAVGALAGGLANAVHALGIAALLLAALCGALWLNRRKAVAAGT